MTDCHQHASFEARACALTPSMVGLGHSRSACQRLWTIQLQAMVWPVSISFNLGLDSPRAPLLGFRDNLGVCLLPQGQLKTQ